MLRRRTAGSGGLRRGTNRRPDHRPSRPPAGAAPAPRGAGAKPRSKDLSRRRRPRHCLRRKRPDWLPPDGLSSSPIPRLSGCGRQQARTRPMRASSAQLIKQTLADFGVPVEVVSIKEGPTVTQFGIRAGRDRPRARRRDRSAGVCPCRASSGCATTWRSSWRPPRSASRRRCRAGPTSASRCRTPPKTLVNLRGVLESECVRGRACRRWRSRSAATSRATRSSPTWRGCPTCSSPARPARASRSASTRSSRSLLMNNGPETVRFVMIDPKMVELPGYNGIPHLLGPVITDPAQATAALSWLMLQMDDRYRLFADAGVRNIDDYNRKARRVARQAPAALHRPDHRRAGRSDDDRRGRRRAPDLPAGADGARDRHPPGAGHAAAPAST